MPIPHKNTANSITTLVNSASANTVLPKLTATKPNEATHTNKVDAFTNCLTNFPLNHFGVFSNPTNTDKVMQSKDRKKAGINNGVSATILNTITATDNTANTTR